MKTESKPALSKVAQKTILAASLKLAKDVVKRLRVRSGVRAGSRFEY